MVRWLTGHAFLGLQDFRAGTTAISVCRLCGQVPERADHVLLDCPRLAQQRLDILGGATLDKRNLEWEVNSVLRFMKETGAEDMEGSLENVDEEELDVVQDEVDDAPLRRYHVISTSESDSS